MTIGIAHDNTKYTMPSKSQFEVNRVPFGLRPGSAGCAHASQAGYAPCTPTSSGCAHASQAGCAPTSSGYARTPRLRLFAARRCVLAGTPVPAPCWEVALHAPPRPSPQRADGPARFAVRQRQLLAVRHSAALRLAARRPVALPVYGFVQRATVRRHTAGVGPGGGGGKQKAAPRKTHRRCTPATEAKSRAARRTRRSLSDSATKKPLPAPRPACPPSPASPPCSR
jgi:hypothetical protein